MPPHRSGTKQVAGDVLASIGLAHLILSHNLSSLLAPANVYFVREAQQDLLYGWFEALGLLSILCYGFVRLTRRKGSAGSGMALACVMITIGAFTAFLLSLGIKSPVPSILFSVALVLTGLYAYIKQALRPFVRAIRRAYELSAFYAVVGIFSAVWAICHPYISPTVDRVVASDAHAPIVWVIFDELDQDWLFKNRPQGVETPNFDAFKATSTSFDAAHRPGPATRISLPALLDGKPVLSSEPSSPEELRVTFKDNQVANWSQTDTVFDGMRKLGRTTSLIGFYHNYGSIFRNKTDHVRAEAFVFYGLLPALEYQFWMFFPENTRTHLQELVGDGDPETRALVAQHRISLARQLEETKTAIENWRSGFVFLHICVPHGPWIGGHNDTTEQGYLVNMVLADQFFGQIRASLVRAGQWNDSTVLVSADHNFRRAMFNMPLNEKVPILIKLPGQTTGIVSSMPVDAVDERWLMEAVAKGQVRSPEQVIRFMEDRAAKS